MADLEGQFFYRLTTATWAKAYKALLNGSIHEFMRMLDRRSEGRRAAVVCVVDRMTQTGPEMGGKKR